MEFRDLLILRADPRLIRTILINAELSRLGAIDNTEYLSMLDSLAKANLEDFREIKSVLNQINEIEKRESNLQ